MRTTYRSVASAAVLILVTAAPVPSAGRAATPPQPAAASGAASSSSSANPVSADFNNDGFDDLAVGAPWEAVGESNEQFAAGVVHVIYGGATGLTAEGTQLISQDESAGGDFEDTAEEFDLFGSALAAGRFNDDEWGDLAIGVHGEDVGPEGSETDGAGAIQVVYGGPTGLSGANDEMWDQGAQLEGVVETFDAFGWSLVAGNFAGDDNDDLAVGAPFEDLGTTTNTGAVNLILGSTTGLTSTGNQIWDQSSVVDNLDEPLDPAEKDDSFSYRLTAGDFGSGSRDDLVVGVPFENLAGANNAGAVMVLFGGSDGLNEEGTFWSQASGLQDDPEPGEQFGQSLTAGTFGRGAKDDLVVGVFEHFPGKQLGGAVNVIYGNATGLTAANSQLWHQDKKGVPNSVEASDFFGASVAAGNFGKGAPDDLAIGTVTDRACGFEDIGTVTILYAGVNGLTATGSKLWHQDSPGVLERCDPGQQINMEWDYFGSSLGAGDFGKTAHADLAAGNYAESVNGLYNAGAVNVLYGSSDGVTADGDQLWHQNSQGIPETAEDGDRLSNASS